VTGAVGGTSAIPGITRQFEAEGYVVFRRALPEELRKFLSLNYQILHRNGYFGFNDGQVENAYAAYGLPLSDSLLELFAPLVGEALGYAVHPTYSYTRFYLPGAVLKRHVDRPSCEISATLPIDYVGARLWPIHLESKTGSAVPVELAPGDLLLYKGDERPHWRDAFEGEWQIQVFLHFVRQGGPYDDYKYDKRPHLGAPISQKLVESRTG